MRALQLWQGNPVRRRIETLLGELEATVATDSAPVDQSKLVELQSLQTLLDAQHRRALMRLRPWVGIGTAFVLIVVLALFSIRERSTQFSARLITPAVHLRVGGEVPLARIGGDDVRFAGFTPQFPLDGAHERRGGRSVSSIARVELHSIDIDSTTEISLLYSGHSGQLHIHLECAPDAGCVSAKLRGVSYSSHQLPHASLAPSPLFLSTAGGAADVSIRIGSDQHQLISGVDVADLSFLDAVESAAGQKGSSLAWSGVVGGEVRLPGVAKDISIEPGDWLDVQGSRVRVTRVAIGDSGLVVLVRGRARRLQLVTPGSVRVLNPTLMETLLARYRARIVIAWTLAAVFIAVAVRAAGILWGRS